MAGVNGVLGHMVDDNRLAALPDLVTKSALDLEFATRLQSKVYVVAHTAGDPTVLGDARDRGETHARRATHDVEDGRDRLDAADGGNVLLERLAHGLHGVRIIWLICCPTRRHASCRGAGAKIKKRTIGLV